MNYRELLEELSTDEKALQEFVMSAVRIDRDQVATDMLKQAEIYMQGAFLAALANQQTRRLKREIEEDVLPAARKDAETILKETKRKSTIKNIEDVAVSDPGYKVRADELSKWETLTAIFKHLTIALTQRSNMLQSLNSRQKVELAAIPDDPRDVTSLDDLPRLGMDTVESPIAGNASPDLEGDIQRYTELYVQKRKAGK